MCGIVGALSLNKPSVNVDYIKPMADKIAHRFNIIYIYRWFI
jgi:asparagine synthase (glutamine-hydrolysing)